jgi:hypothetical protein
LGNDKSNNVTICKSAAIVSSGLTWGMEPFPVTAPTLNRNSLTPRQAPPLLETPTHALTSLTSLFYKSHTWPRVWAAPSFPSQPGSSGLPLNFALGCETFLMSFLCE